MPKIHDLEITYCPTVVDTSSETATILNDDMSFIGDHYFNENAENNNINVNKPPSSVIIKSLPHSPPPPPPFLPLTSTSCTSSSFSPPIPPSSKRRLRQHRRIIRSKKNRLLLLRHVTTCNNPNHRGCAKMKSFCHHLAHCRDKNCAVPKCLSSRYIISHYRNCRDVNCEVCIPTKASIRRGRDRKRERDHGMVFREMSLSPMVGIIEDTH